MQTQTFDIDMSQFKEETIQKTVHFFGTLADTTRIMIVSFLIDGERPIHKILKFLKKSIPKFSKWAISYQLKLLLKNDILRVEKRGRERFFRLADNHILHILKDGMRHISGQDPCDEPYECEVTRLNSKRTGVK